MFFLYKYVLNVERKKLKSPFCKYMLNKRNFHPYVRKNICINMFKSIKIAEYYVKRVKKE